MEKICASKKVAIFSHENPDPDTIGSTMALCRILQAMGKAAASTMLSMIREVVFGVGFALLLPLFWGLDGVLYSMPVSDILTFAVAIILIVRTYRELGKKQAAWE